MNQLDEAVLRYQKLLETEPYNNLGWAEQLEERMHAEHLTRGGRVICPFLRPHFLSRRQYDSMAKAAELLFSAIDRVKQLALENPGLLSRMELLPAEKMLASINPGYPFLAVTSRLNAHLCNGAMYFVECNADTPSGVAYGEALADLFFDTPPMKELRKRYALQKVGGRKFLLNALLKAYKEFGGKRAPRIAILEFRQPFQSEDEGEYLLVRDFFRAEGYQTEIISPEQLEYRGGVLRKGSHEIDLVYRRIKVQEFLLRYDLSHPLVRAYRDGAVCVVNSFRSELAHKRAIFDLLTDPAVAGNFPAAERKAIRQYIPWTRMVSAAKVSHGDETVDLPDFILKNREKLVLKPNDDSGDQHVLRGWETDENTWDRALRRALRTPYVVQEKIEANRCAFPVFRYGQLETKEVHVEVHPHAYLGKVQGCSSWLTGVNGGGFSSVSGLAPTFILEGKAG